MTHSIDKPCKPKLQSQQFGDHQRHPEEIFKGNVFIYLLKEGPTFFFFLI